MGLRDFGLDVAAGRRMARDALLDVRERAVVDVEPVWGR